MIEVKALEDSIIELIVTGTFDEQQWQNYQDTIIAELDKSDEKRYFLSNFADVTGFQKEIFPQFGTARHLTHPRLGFIVLLGNSTIQQFALKLTENRASKENRDTAMRIHIDRERALEVLRHRINIDTINPQSKAE